MEREELALREISESSAAPRIYDRVARKIFGYFAGHTRISAESATVAKSRTREPFREVSMIAESVPDHPDHVPAYDLGPQLFLTYCS